ncbi:MAG: aspartate kinase [Marinifilaceae bacterium]
MKIYKFGGASVKDSDGVKNLCSIVSAKRENLIIVVSAMGKMTNKFEEVVNSYFYQQEGREQFVQEVKDFHYNIIQGLFPRTSVVYEKVEKLFSELESCLLLEPSLCYDYEYDRIIPFGERLSTTIISEYLNQEGCKNKFVDVRKAIISDSTYRNANVDMEISRDLCKKRFTFQDTFTYVTQGFIAGTSTNQTTTLGREGSDYTAAILANLLDAEDVTIWKDVPGIMNADPKAYADTTIISRLSYREAIELSNYGAQVIHPKTIKPLENKGISLLVKSFTQPQEPGSVIKAYNEKLALPPIFIDKTNLMLITVTPKDFSVIAEDILLDVISTMNKYRLKLNLIQTSAISFSFCVDKKSGAMEKFISDLKENYEVLYNDNVALLTVRHYTDEVIDKLTKGKQMLVAQKSRRTARFIFENQ